VPDDFVTRVSFEAQPAPGLGLVCWTLFSGSSLGFPQDVFRFFKPGLACLAQTFLLSLTPSRLQSSFF